MVDGVRMYDAADTDTDADHDADAAADDADD